MTKKSRNLVLPPSQSTFEYGSENRPWIRGISACILIPASPFYHECCVRLRMFAEYENEENVLVCLRIIIELHKQFRPAHSQEYTSRDITFISINWRLQIFIHSSDTVLCCWIEQQASGRRLNVTSLNIQISKYNFMYQHLTQSLKIFQVLFNIYQKPNNYS